MDHPFPIISQCNKNAIMDSKVTLFIVCLYISLSNCTYFSVILTEGNDTLDTIPEEKQDSIFVSVNGSFTEENKEEQQDNIEQAISEAYTEKSNPDAMGTISTADCPNTDALDKDLPEPTETEAIDEELADVATEIVPRETDDIEVDKQSGPEQKITPGPPAFTQTPEEMVRIFQEENHGRQRQNKQTTTDSPLMKTYPERVMTMPDIAPVKTTQRMGFLDNRESGAVEETRRERQGIYQDIQDTGIPIGSMEEVNGVKHEIYEVDLQNTDGMVKSYPPGILKDISGEEERTVCLPQGSILGKRRLGDVRIGT